MSYHAMCFVQAQSHENGTYNHVVMGQSPLTEKISTDLDLVKLQDSLVPAAGNMFKCRFT